MIVLSMRERSYVDDVNDHKGRVNGVKMLLSPRSGVQTQVFSGAERMFNQEEKGRSGKRRAAAPPTVNGDGDLAVISGNQFQALDNSEFDNVNLFHNIGHTTIQPLREQHEEKMLQG